MPSIDDLILKYFATNDDVQLEGERAPDTFKGNVVDFLVDGSEYFGAIGQEIKTLLAKTKAANETNRACFYLANWTIGLVTGPAQVTTKGIASAWPGGTSDTTLPPFTVNAGSGQMPLIDLMEKMAITGVDVRCFAWTSPILFEAKKISALAEALWARNVHSLLSSDALRNRPGFQEEDRYKKIIMDTLNHSVGSMHLKMVLCGDDTDFRAYVSGLDLVTNRNATWQHPVNSSQREFWHDAGVRLRGPAAAAVHEYYRSVWKEQLRRDIKTFRLDGKPIVSHFEDTPQVPERVVTATPGPAAVQVLRTLPKMDIAFSGTASVHPSLGDIPIVDALIQCIARLILGFQSPQISFARHGLFEFSVALRKAISQAESIIYLEDQSFSGFPIMDWINARMKENTLLKVIFLHGYDPADPKSGFMYAAVNDHLLKDIPDAASRVAFYERNGGILVHTKLTIIDDQWAAIGSANSMRRSLFMDGECSVAVVDGLNPSFAQRLRMYLWGEHCGLAPPLRNHPVLQNLDKAIGLWSPLVNQGNVKVTSGSPVVTGTGTTWPFSSPDWSIQIAGQATTYTVASIDTRTQLTLDRGYVGATAGGLSYALFNNNWPRRPAGIALRPELGYQQLPFNSPALDEAGTISLTHGSNNVQGAGTAWDDTLKDRFLHVVGDTLPLRQTYKIDEVVAPDKLRLLAPYGGPSGGGRSYQINKPDDFLIESLACFDPVDYNIQEGDSHIEY